MQLPDGLHWDLLRIYQGMLEAVGQLFRDAAEGPLWVGIDSWGVDYGLLDASGHLLGPPFHYRDNRTEGRLEELDRLVGLEQLYEATGIHEMALNTICQLLAERGSGAYSVASHLLLVPDLLAYLLTGERRLERTNASTTQLVDARTGELVEWLFPLLGLRRELFAPPVQPGEHYGQMLPEVAASVGMAHPPVVVAVTSHDTASAVLAVPALTESFAYVVSGTWSLVGMELDAPVISEASWRANFSNELGYGGTVRFLKNVMGHWMLQECERCWALEGRSVRLVDLLAEAEACPPFRSLVDTADPVFAVPGDMPRLVRSACERSGEPVPESDGALVRCLLDSMALAICWPWMRPSAPREGRRVPCTSWVGVLPTASCCLYWLLAAASKCSPGRSRLLPSATCWCSCTPPAGSGAVRRCASSWPGPSPWREWRPTSLSPRQPRTHAPGGLLARAHGALRRQQGAPCSRRRETLRSAGQDSRGPACALPCSSRASTTLSIPRLAGRW